MSRRKIRVLVALTPNGYDAAGWGFPGQDEDPKAVEASISNGWARDEAESGQPVRYQWITATLEQPDPVERSDPEDVEAEVES